MYNEISFGWWSVEVLAVSILATWLFNIGHGSLWTPCLFHATANMSYTTLTHLQGNSTISLILAVIATAVVLIFWLVNLSRTMPRQILMDR